MPASESGGKRTYNAGSATWPATNHESISGLAIDASGRIVAAGTFSAQDVSPRFALLRFRADGSTGHDVRPQLQRDGHGVRRLHQGCVRKRPSGPRSRCNRTARSWSPAGSGWPAPAVWTLTSRWRAFCRMARWTPADSATTGTSGHSLATTTKLRAVKVAGGSLYVAGHSDGLAMVARYSLSNGSLVTDFDGGVVDADDTVHGPGFCPCRPELSVSRHLLRSDTQTGHRRDVHFIVMSVMSAAQVNR